MNTQILYQTFGGGNIDPEETTRCLYCGAIYHDHLELSSWGECKPCWSSRTNDGLDTKVELEKKFDGEERSWK